MYVSSPSGTTFPSTYFFSPQIFQQHINICQTLCATTETLTTQTCYFYEHTLHSGWPSNTFVVLQLPVQLNSGLLLTPDGPLPALEAIQHLCGKFFLDAAANANTACTQQGAPFTYSWYDNSQWMCGGWKGLFLVADGTAVRFSQMLGGLKSMVERWAAASFLTAFISSHPGLCFSLTFDFMLSFGAASPNPAARPWGAEFTLCGTPRLPTSEAGSLIQVWPTPCSCNLQEVPMEVWLGLWAGHSRVCISAI